MTEEEESENQMKEIQNSLPPEVYETFSKCWNDFIDGCSQNVPEGTYADDDEGDEMLWEHLDLFFADTSGEDTENPLPPEVYYILTKQCGDFIETFSQSGEHIEDLDKYFDQYLEIFMKYPH